MILLAASPRRFGRAGHVELLLLLGDVGQDRAQPLEASNKIASVSPPSFVFDHDPFGEPVSAFRIVL